LVSPGSGKSWHMEHTGLKIGREDRKKEGTTPDLTALVAGAEERMVHVVGEVVAVGAGLRAPVDRGQGQRLRLGPQRRGGRTLMVAAPMEDRRGAHGAAAATGGRAPDPGGGGGGLWGGHMGRRRTGGGRTGWRRTLGARWGGFDSQLAAD
jgi:hypothetical protein